MKWWYVPLFYVGLAVAGYIWGMFTTIARNDTKARKKPTGEK